MFEKITKIVNKLGLKAELETPRGSTLIKIYDKNPELSFMMIIIHKGHEDIATINVELGYYDTFKIGQIVMALSTSGIQCLMSRCFTVDTSGKVLFDKDAYAYIESMINQVDELAGLDARVSDPDEEIDDEDGDEESSYGEDGDHLIFPTKKITDGRGSIH